MNNILPEETMIEVIAISKEQIFKKIMTYKEALNIEKKKGFRYINFQLGFSSFKNNVNIK